MSQYTCKNCGTKYSSGQNYAKASHLFCSGGCEIKFNNLSNSSSISSAPREIDYEANAFAAAERASANAERARISYEKQKHEDEMSLKFKQQELEEKKNKQKRADELRSQGKGIQALIVEYNLLQVFGFVVIIGGLWLLSTHFLSESETKNNHAKEFNQKLELIDDQIKIALQKGNKDEVLMLANKLIHPDHVVYEAKTGGFTTIYYDEYWTLKREEYKNLILGGKEDDEKTVNVNKEKSEIEENTSVTPTDVTTAESDGSSETTVEENNFAYANLEKVYFYNSPSLSSIGKAYVAEGQQVNVLEKLDDFYKVLYKSENGKSTEGYMRISDLDKH